MLSSPTKATFIRGQCNDRPRETSPRAAKTDFCVDVKWRFKWPGHKLCQCRPGVAWWLRREKTQETVKDELLKVLSANKCELYSKAIESQQWLRDIYLFLHSFIKYLPPRTFYLTIIYWAHRGTGDKAKINKSKTSQISCLEGADGIYRYSGQGKPHWEGGIWAKIWKGWEGEPCGWTARRRASEAKGKARVKVWRQENWDVWGTARKPRDRSGVVHCSGFGFYAESEGKPLYFSEQRHELPGLLV